MITFGNHTGEDLVLFEDLFAELEIGFDAIINMLSELARMVEE